MLGDIYLDNLLLYKFEKYVQKLNVFAVVPATGN